MNNADRTIAVMLGMAMEWAFVFVLSLLIAKCFGWAFTGKSVVGAWLIRQLLTVKIGINIGEEEE